MSTEEFRVASGKIASQAESARQEDITLSMVTQTMGMPRLAPEIHRLPVKFPLLQKSP